MEGLRNKQLQLLRELDKLCQDNRLAYILSWHCARSAFLTEDFPRRITVPTVAMRYTDALRLRELGKDSGRCFECAFDNRGIPRMVMRFSDPDSSCINVSELNAFHHNGISVDIELLRAVPARGIVNKVMILLEDVCILAANLRESSRLWRAVLKLFAPLERAFLRRIYSAPGGKRLRISRFPKKSVEFSAALLENTAPLCIRGASFQAPADFEEYMRIEFGEKWSSGDHEKAVEDLHLAVFDENMSGSECLELLRDIDMDDASIPWVRWFLLRGRMRFLRKRIEANWDLLHATGARFALWKEYMPKKAELLALRDKGRQEELREALEHYLAELRHYHRRGIVVVFDREIFELTLWVLKKEGKENWAEQLEKDVIPAHLEPITIEVAGHD